MFGKCTCKPKPTSKPPKQCKELVGMSCKHDGHCGVGGYCDRKW